EPSALAAGTSIRTGRKRIVHLFPALMNRIRTGLTDRDKPEPLSRISLLQARRNLGCNQANTIDTRCMADVNRCSNLREIQSIVALHEHHAVSALGVYRREHPRQILPGNVVVIDPESNLAAAPFQNLENDSIARRTAMNRRPGHEN